MNKYDVIQILKGLLMIFLIPLFFLFPLVWFFMMLGDVYDSVMGTDYGDFL